MSDERKRDTTQTFPTLAEVESNPKRTVGEMRVVKLPQDGNGETATEEELPLVNDEETLDPDDNDPEKTQPMLAIPPEDEVLPSFKSESRSVAELSKIAQYNKLFNFREFNLNPQSFIPPDRAGEWLLWFEKLYEYFEPLFSQKHKENKKLVNDIGLLQVFVYGINNWFKTVTNYEQLKDVTSLKGIFLVLEERDLLKVHTKFIELRQIQKQIDAANLKNDGEFLLETFFSTVDGTRYRQLFDIFFTSEE